jgi:hypothetical protein
MSNFEMRSQTPQSGSSIPQEKWDEWNDYVDSMIEGEDINDGGHLIKEISSVGYLNLLIQAGYIPQEDAEFDSKCALPKEGEKNSEEELAHIEKFPNNYFKWDGKKRKVCRPQHPKEEYIFAVDFPDIMLDYSKHPAAEEGAEEDLKPLRISYNGKWQGSVGKHVSITLKDGKLSPKNILYKVAAKSGRLQELLDSPEDGKTNYDIGVVAGAVCKWTIQYKKSPGRDGIVFHNIDIKEPAAIEPIKNGSKVIASVEDQIPDCPTKFTGILLDQDEYSDDDLKQIRKEFKGLLETGVSFKPSPVKYPDFTLGTDWKDTALCKALEARAEAFRSSQGDDSSSDEEGSTSQQNEPESASEEASNDSFDEDGFEADIRL